jgi:hypothetical protein
MRYKPLISLALALHLFAVVLAMSGNMSPSMLQQRLRFLLSPYLISFNWYLDFVPVELTHGIETDGLWWIQIRDTSVSNDWQTITPSTASYLESTHRIRQVARLAGLMTMQQRTAEATTLLEGFIAKQAHDGKLPVQRSNRRQDITAPAAPSPPNSPLNISPRSIEVRIIRQPVRDLEEVQLANKIGAELDPLPAQPVFTAKAVEGENNHWFIIPQSEPRRMVPTKRP